MKTRECTCCGTAIQLGEPHASLCGQGATNERLRQQLLAGFEAFGYITR